MGRVDLSERLLAQALVMRERGGAVVHRVGRSRGARNVSRGCELSRGSQATCCRRACRPSAPRFKPTTKIQALCSQGLQPADYFWFDEGTGWPALSG